MLLFICQMENCILEHQQTSWDETLPFSEHLGYIIQSELSNDSRWLNGKNVVF